MKQSRAIFSASIAVALGVGSAVAAAESPNLLQNASFESPSCSSSGNILPTDWIRGSFLGDFEAMHCKGDGSAVDGGQVAGFDRIAAGKGAKLFAHQYVEFCGKYGLGLDWAAGGNYRATGGDTAGISVTFTNGESGGKVTGLSSEAFSSEGAALGGQLPALQWAQMRLWAFDSNGDGLVNVAWDEVYFTANCAEDYAQVKGLAGEDPQGKRRGQYFMEGAFGTANCDQGGDTVGTLTVDFLTQGFSCTFTPGKSKIKYSGASANEDSRAVVDVNYTCTGSQVDGGEAELWFLQGTGQPLTSNPDQKDRGMFGWDPISGGLATGDLGDHIALRSGNVRILAQSCGGGHD